MNRDHATSLFESLASGARLDVFRLLVKHEPQGLNAGDIAAALAIPASTLSFHLKALSHSGLVTASPSSRFIRYRANVPVMFELIAYLTDDCCGGQPGLCAEVPTTQSTVSDETGKSACSSCG